MPETLRTFIAVEISFENRKKLDTIIQTLKKDIPGGVRWVPAQNIHVTLKFLGETPGDSLPGIKTAIPEAAKQSTAFPFSLTGLGAFPNLHKPRVLWLGVEAPQSLTQLAGQVDRLTQPLGFPSEDRPFKPHLTLGRIAESAAAADLERIHQVFSTRKFAPIQCTAARVDLMQSDLRPGGAVYTSLYHFDLPNG